MAERMRLTDDGLATLYSVEFNQYYHSVRGVLEESEKVYVGLGFQSKIKDNECIDIFEMGLGTGFNVLMTVLVAQKEQVTVRYTSIEAFPISSEDLALLNYPAKFDTNLFAQIHQAEWGEFVEIIPNFYLKKVKTTLQAFPSDTNYDVIYYDAFAPSSQPELWTEEVFAKLFKMTKDSGVLTTYCSKSVVRKALEGVGYRVEKHPGPWGKRDVIRAVK
ncbi:MAG: tRNA (5-methylaminomethyl-2-thiouridine)(34)-methyltransferase MnmD [Flectobacillus sp.]|nr:tRNA (5-methylaminomethyl-2-thiouridine)(34)-methyltransferase MnmD [Flectobacillus sp.]